MASSSTSCQKPVSSLQDGDVKVCRHSLCGMTDSDQIDCPKSRSAKTNAERRNSVSGFMVVIHSWSPWQSLPGNWTSCSVRALIAPPRRAGVSRLYDVRHGPKCRYGAVRVPGHFVWSRPQTRRTAAGFRALLAAKHLYTRLAKPLHSTDGNC